MLILLLTERLGLPEWNPWPQGWGSGSASEFCRQNCLEVAPGPYLFKLVNLLSHRFQEKLAIFFFSLSLPGDLGEHVTFYLILILCFLMVHWPFAVGLQSSQIVNANQCRTS